MTAPTQPAPAETREAWRRPAQARENSAEWFHSQADGVRRKIETWPQWMRDCLDVAAARWPR